MVKIKTLVLFLALWLFQGCFSVYPTFYGKKCNEVKKPHKTNLRNILKSRFRKEEFKVTDEYFKYVEDSIAYEFIKQIKIQKKTAFLGVKKWWILIYTYDGEKYSIYTKEGNLVHPAFSSLRCLADIENRNGKRVDPNSNKEEDDEGKYDKLKKLKELLDSGAITEEEYEREKEKILNQE